jgi:predicted nucleic acid-binding protein
MILVDTSVWIEFFNGTGALAARVLENLLEGEEDLCISEFILAEVLQGFRKDADFDLARDHLLRFPICSLKTPSSYIKAAQIYRKCRKRGMTIRKTVDCVIAQTAIEYKLALLHNDSDFDRIAKVSPLTIFFSG